MVVAILIGTLSFPLVNSVLATTSATGLEKTSKVVNFNNVAGGLSVTQNRVFKQFASALPSGSWTIDFDYKYTASNIPTFGIFVLSATSDDPQIQSAPNQLEIIHGNFIGDNALSVEGPLSTTSAEIPISPNVQYYVELDKMPTLLTL